MEKEAVCTGKTVDEALEKALVQLGVAREKAQFEIIDLPKKGMLGLKSTPAKVRVFVSSTKRDCALEYLKSVFDCMGLTNVNIAVSETEGGAAFQLSGSGLGILIGRRGETLDALQYLTSLVANRQEGEYFRVVLDSDNYREKRVKTLELLAKKISSQVARTGKSVTLEPMNPYDRRIIHSTVQTISGVSSTSTGDEPNRRVIISSDNPKKTFSDSSGRQKQDGKGGKKSEHRGIKPIPERGRQRAPSNNSKKAEENHASKIALPEKDFDKPLYSKIEID